jgi:hypothetical protein
MAGGAGTSRSGAAAGRTPSTVQLAFGEVLVEGAAPHDVARSIPAMTRWPCPGCGTRRIMDDVWRLTVSDPPGGTNRREVVVCAICAANAGEHPTIAPPDEI